MKTDTETMIVPAEMMAPLTDLVMRAHVLVERIQANLPTGSEVVGEMEEKAEAYSYRAHVMLGKLDDGMEDWNARSLGWPSADELKKFLFNGAKPVKEAGH